MAPPRSQPAASPARDVARRRRLPGPPSAASPRGLSPRRPPAPLCVVEAPGVPPAAGPAASPAGTHRAPAPGCCGRCAAAPRGGPAPRPPGPLPPPCRAPATRGLQLPAASAAAQCRKAWRWREAGGPRGLVAEAGQGGRAVTGAAGPGSRPFPSRGRRRCRA